MAAVDENDQLTLLYETFCNSLSYILFGCHLLLWLLFCNHASFWLTVVVTRGSSLETTLSSKLLFIMF